MHLHVFTLFSVVCFACVIRLMLTLTAECLDDAGMAGIYSQDAHRRARTGVFVGASSLDSMSHLLGWENRLHCDTHTVTGNNLVC